MALQKKKKKIKQTLGFQIKRQPFLVLLKTRGSTGFAQQKYPLQTFTTIKSTEQV